MKLIYKNGIKRIIDFLLSLMFFIAISPLFGVLCIMVAIKLGNPIFFKQKRTTKDGKEFEIIKFRSMTEDKDELGNYLPNEMRMTKFGKFLRTSSLDELPELLNIIKGDMAIIGPRPLPPVYNSFFYNDEMKRFDVRGGLIPPDSVDENSIISWDKQFEYEREYADKVSFTYDIYILISVFKILFNRKKSDYGSYCRQPLNVERSEMRRDEKNDK